MPELEFEDNVADELLRMHVASTRPIVMATVGNASLLLYLLHDGVEPEWGMSLWWVVFMLLMAARHHAGTRWVRDPSRRANHATWRLRFALIVGLSGLMWGLPGSLLYPTSESGLRPISALVQMGVSAAAVMSLSSVQLLYRSFFLAMMLPSIVWLLVFGGHVEHLTALALSLFTVLLLIGGKRSAGIIEDGIRLRHQLARALREADVARQTAEHANATKTIFLTNMSHELRTPLHGILSFADLGHARAQDSRLQQYFSRIRESGDRLHGLINNLLDVTRQTADATRQENVPIDMQALIQRLLDMREDRLRAKQLTAEVTQGGEAGRIQGTYLSIERMLDHLLGNAIRYSRPDTVIRIRLDWKADFIDITLSDQGVGIPEGELESIFEHFAQSSRTRTDAGGTGLGLTIAREIARQHGGDVTARNNSAGGADFVVRLPLATGARATP